MPIESQSLLNQLSIIKYKIKSLSSLAAKSEKPAIKNLIEELIKLNDSLNRSLEKNNIAITDKNTVITTLFDGSSTNKNSDTHTNIHADLTAINTFFTNEEEVKLALTEMDEQLKKMAMQKSMYDEKENLLKNSFSSGLFATTSDKAFKQEKLLSSFLYHFAKEAGFIGICKVTKILSTPDFLNIVGSGYVIKDKGQGGLLHGEWTHILQLWLIDWKIKHEAKKVKSFFYTQFLKLSGMLGMKSKANNNVAFLETDLAKLYMFIGKQKNVSLWSNTFDMVTELTLFSINSPETLILKILMNENLTVLRPLILGRLVKRIEQYENIVVSTMSMDTHTLKPA